VVLYVYMNDMSFHLRLLHVAHVADSAGAQGELRDCRRSGRGWQDALGLLESLRRDAGVDLVFYAGEAAGTTRGAESPAAVAAFLAPLLDRLGLGPERLFAVPDRQPMAPPVSGTRIRSPLGFRQELRLDRLPFAVQVIAFDSLGRAGGAPRGLGRRPAATEIERLSSGPRGEALPGFRLGLVRQSLTGIDQGTAAALRLAGRVDLLLSGAGTAIDVAGGAAWRADTGFTAGREGPFIACQMITVTCDAAGRPDRLILRRHRASPRDVRTTRSVPLAVPRRERFPCPANEEPPPAPRCDGQPPSAAVEPLPPAPPIAALRTELAERLLARGYPGDRRQALALLRQALAEEAPAAGGADSSGSLRLRSVARRSALDWPT
jgi:hypothetical protein